MSTATEEEEELSQLAKKRRRAALILCPRRLPRPDGLPSDILFMAEILHNSKARRDYHILETFEAGIVLHGSEVKTLRAGKAQISDAFARVEKNEVWLYNAHIDEYAQANRFGHQPKAPRKLLLHKSEIRKLLRPGRQSKATPSFRFRSTGKTGKVKVVPRRRQGQSGVRQTAGHQRSAKPTAN